MIEYDDRLRETLAAIASRSAAVPPSAQALLRTHRRRVHRRNAAAGASLAAFGVGAWALTDVVGGATSGQFVRIGPATSGGPTPAAAVNPACAGTSPDQSADKRRTSMPSTPVATPGTFPRPTATASGSTAAQSAGSDPSDGLAPARQALARITLPHPAPGFPVQRGDVTAMNSFGSGDTVWTRVILLAVKPATTTQLAPGVIDTTPNGQEASILVACRGAFPTSPAQVTAAGEYTVIGTTIARGQTATVVRSDTHQIGVLVTVDGLDIAAYGDSSAVPNDPVVPDQLVTLIDNLQHLDG